jgi:hypothetical protein
VRTSGIYEVTGTRRFRGHTRGDIFEASLDQNAEARAVRRGDIRLIERIVPSIQPGSYQLPHGWLTQKEEVQ